MVVGNGPMRQRVQPSKIIAAPKKLRALEMKRHAPFSCFSSPCPCWGIFHELIQIE